MSRKTRKRGRGRVLILVVLLALIVFGVFARGIFTSGKTTTERAQRELHTYAEQHETSLAGGCKRIQFADASAVLCVWRNTSVKA